MNIIVRPLNYDIDSSFIFSTWRRNTWYSGFYRKTMDRKTWSDIFIKYMNSLLPKCNIYIACADDDPEIIIGYLIVHNKTLEFIYVKEGFRKQGIAKLLIKNKNIKDVNETNITKIGKSLIYKLKENHERHIGQAH